MQELESFERVLTKLWWCRNKAVRLVANRLYAEGSLQEAITAFATAKVKELLPSPKSTTAAIQASAANSSGELLFYFVRGRLMQTVRDSA